MIRLEHGQPIRFGTPARTASAPRASSATRPTGDCGRRRHPGERADGVLVHDAHAASPDHRVRALPAGRPGHPAPHAHRGPARRANGRSTTRQMADQLDAAVEQHGKGDLGALLAGNDTWTVVG